MKSILDVLGKKRIYFDGGFGTQLQKRGIKTGELPESWNLSHPEEIIAIHSDYLNAGAMIIGSNTFGANRLKYGDDTEAVVKAGVNLVKEAIKRSGKEAWCALDIGSLGRLLAPLGDLEFEEAVDIFAQVVRFGAEAGADLVLIETMNDTYEAKAAVLAARENCDLPIFVTCVFDETHKMLTGGTPEAMVALMEGLRVDALGINCSLGPAQMLPVVKRIAEVSSTPVIVNPNAGLPRVEKGQTVYDVDATEFAEIMKEIATYACGLGGCCGTTPDHISATVKATADIPVPEVTAKNLSVCSSYTEAVYFGKKPIIIGERINPTGKKRFKQALIEADYDYIMAQGLAQEDAGAHVLDVNVGLPEIDEPAMLTETIKRLQGVTTLPLQIDSSDALAMEAALRAYNGKAMINSVNGKQEVMDAIFPLAAKYGGLIVGLPLDEEGIPDNPQGRVAIAERIYKEAEKYGIGRNDIIIDGLALTVSADSGSALCTLETIKRIREDFGGLTSLGVSNISFGLPRRELINSTFFTMAMLYGLSGAIINPENAAMMDAYRGFLALTDLDPGFESYIGAYGGQENTPKAAPAVAGGGMGLNEAIMRGMAGPARDAAKEEIKKRPPLEIVNEDLITALNTVGEAFEKGKLFLPQLLMSAEAAQAAFEVIKSTMGESSGPVKGKVILATVKGDVHDIGKNIVKVLLENYGYDVVDLGKDVDPEVILSTVKEQDIKVVGLSALMTTTVVSMEETIKLLRKEAPGTKVVVGGAVLTQEYADAIDADCYSKDAISTVRYCDEIFG